MNDYPYEGGVFEAAFAALPDRAVFPWACREADEKAATTAGAKRKSKTKYTCTGGCGTNIWGKPGIEAVCSGCDERFDEAA